MTISGERTEQLYIFCHVTGFTSDFLSFIDAEHIRFFHRALQLSSNLVPQHATKTGRDLNSIEVHQSMFTNKAGD